MIPFSKPFLFRFILGLWLAINSGIFLSAKAETSFGSQTCEPESTELLDQVFSRQSYLETSQQGVSKNFAFDLTGAAFSRDVGANGKFAVIDEGFETEHLSQGSRIFSGALQSGPKRAEHGTGVTNVILEASAHSTATELVSFDDMYHPDRIDALISRLKASGTNVVNISYTMGDDKNIRDSIQKLLDAKIVVVASSGNFGKHFDNASAQMHRNNQIPGVIYVGSISQYGTIDDYSRTGHAMTIMAPVGDALGVQFNEHGELRVRGTSFAAPQVTAAVADVQALLPQITSEEVQQLMGYAAVQTINGPMLNHSRMIEVAKKLKENGWPSSRSQISDPETYRFTEKSEALLAQVSSASNDQQRVRLLQQAFLLDPEGAGEKARQKLAELKSLGPISDFYRSLDLENSQNYLAELAQHENQDVREMAMRSAALLNPSSKREVYTSALRSNQTDVRIETLQAVLREKDPFYLQNVPDEILSQLSQRADSPELTQLALASLSTKYSDSRIPNELVLQLQDPKRTQNLNAVDREILDFSLEPQNGNRDYIARLVPRLTEKFRNSPEPAVRKTLIDRLSRLPSPEGLNEIGQIAQNDRDAEVRQAALSAALEQLRKEQSDEEAFLFLHQQISSSNQNSRSQEFIHSYTKAFLDESKLQSAKGNQKFYGTEYEISEQDKLNFRDVLLVRPKALGSFVRIFYLEAPNSLVRKKLADALQVALTNWRNSPESLATYLQSLINKPETDHYTDHYVEKAAKEALALLDS